MATKLRRYFTLCPLADQSKLQGVSKHPEIGCVLVTLSRNMVSKYKVTEQRPVSSWSSRDAMCGAAVYDSATSQYAVMLGSNQIRTWREEDKKLEPLKKFSFSTKIFRVMCGPDGKIFVVFVTGACLPLDQAIEGRKQAQGGVLGKQETLTQCHLEQARGSTVLLLITLSTQGVHTVYLQELRDNEASVTSKTFALTCGALSLSGVTLRSCDNQLSLLSLWSDGQLYSLPLLVEGEEVPGRPEGKVEGVKADQKVALLPLSATHLAFYGAESSEEGASLLIYNTQFRVVQAKQRLKLYSNPPLMWGPFGSDLVLASGSHLLAVTFELGHETLASMLASNKRKAGSEVHRPSWGAARVAEEEASHFPTAPDSVRLSLDSMTKQGLSEAAMSEAVLPGLLDKKDVSAIAWVLGNLRDVTESVLARLVSFCLREEESSFAALAPSPPCNASVLPLGETTASLPPESPLGGGRLCLLDKALCVPFNAGRLLPELRRHLAPQDAMLLLRHASARLWHGDTPDETTETHVAQLLSWSCVMLDANYQHCLLSMDTEVLHTLTALSDIVDTQIGHVEELRALEPIIRRMKDGRHLPKPKADDQIYSIETIQLY